MYELNVSGRARHDIDGIISYISNSLFAPTAAMSLAEKIDKCFDKIEENPYFYPECLDLRLKNEGFRRALVGNYVMIYKIYEETKSVIAHYVFHSSQDYANLI